MAKKKRLPQQPLVRNRSLQAASERQLEEQDQDLDEHSQARKPDNGRHPGAAKAHAGISHEDWSGFFAAGLRPATERLRFIFRAITPPTRSKRFDARFFLADTSIVSGDPDDLSRASGELSHLSWLTLAEARALDLPFITEVVLAEVEARLRAPEAPRPTPFFHHDDNRSFLDHL